MNHTTLVALYVLDSLKRTGSQESLLSEPDYSGCTVCFWFTKKNQFIGVTSQWIGLHWLLQVQRRMQKAILTNKIAQMKTVILPSFTQMSCQSKMKSSEYLMELQKLKFCNHTEPLLNIVTHQATPWDNLIHTLQSVPLSSLGFTFYKDSRFYSSHTQLYRI